MHEIEREREWAEGEDVMSEEKSTYTRNKKS